MKLTITTLNTYRVPKTRLLETFVPPDLYWSSGLHTSGHFFTNTSRRSFVLNLFLPIFICLSNHDNGGYGSDSCWHLKDVNKYRTIVQGKAASCVMYCTTYVIFHAVHSDILLFEWQTYWGHLSAENLQSIITFFLKYIIKVLVDPVITISC